MISAYLWVVVLGAICSVVQAFFLASSLAGTALIFPGHKSIDWGLMLEAKPPFLSGLGPTYLAWFTLPAIAFQCAALFMLSFRRVLRKEDPLHQLMWRLPTISCAVTIVGIGYILYALASPQGYTINKLNPQGAVVVVCACGIGVSLYTCLIAPCSIRRFGYATRREAQIRRMNLLGLSDEVIQELAAHQSPANHIGWLRFLCNYCLQKDVYADINKSEDLMQLQSSAEQFDPNTEGLFHQMLIFMCVLLSAAYSSSMFHSAGGIFAAMLNIYQTAEVATSFPVPIYLRCIMAVCTSCGVVVAGGRLMPLTGVQLAKMTPIRANVVMYSVAVASIVGRILGMEVEHVYTSIAGIVAVGVVEGLSHVNWRLYTKMVIWSSLSCIAVLLATAFLNWQGTRAPSAANMAQIQADARRLQVSNSALKSVLGHASSDIPQMAGPPVPEMDLLQMQVQQLIHAYNAIVSTCPNETVH